MMSSARIVPNASPMVLNGLLFIDGVGVMMFYVRVTVINFFCYDPRGDARPTATAMPTKKDEAEDEDDPPSTSCRNI